MIPIEQHIAQLKRFEKEIQSLRDQIKVNKDNENIQLPLFREYYDLQEIWAQIDEFIEMKVKTPLDIRNDP